MFMEKGGGMATLPKSPEISGVSEEKVRCRIGADCWCVLDGEVVEWEEGKVSGQPGTGGEESEDGADHSLPCVTRWKDGQAIPAGREWVVKKSQWRLRVQPVATTGFEDEELGRLEVVMEAVRIEAYTAERFRNQARGFLG